MNLELLFCGSYVNWPGVAESWAKRTIPSRLLLFAARSYISASRDAETVDSPLDLEPLLEAESAREIAAAVASPPDPQSELAGEWGRFLDAAFRAELELVQYGERPLLLAEVRQGLAIAASESEAADRPSLARWFEARRDELPGDDIPAGTGYIPV